MSAAGPDLQHRTVAAGGIRFHVVEAGTGPLVLLLHGFAQHWISWRHQLPALAAAGFRAVALDLRGAGSSDKPPRGYDAFTLSDDISGVIKALGEDSATLVGQGYGGVLAFNVATIHPEVVDRVVAIAAPHPARLARWRKPRVDAYGRLLTFSALPIAPHRRLVRGHGAFVERLIRSHAGAAWPGTQDFAQTMVALRDAIVKPGAARGALEQLRWVARSPWRGDGRRHRTVLERRIEVPVLHLAGEDDTFTPETALAEAIHHCIGGYRRVSLAGVGHYPAEEAPSQVNTLIKDFLLGSAGSPSKPNPRRR